MISSANSAADVPATSTTSAFSSGCSGSSVASCESGSSAG
jgi:hypothetical protein